MGGVCLEVERAPLEGESVDVSLFLVDDEVEDASHPALAMRGRVAWTAQPEERKRATMGVRFEGVSALQMAGLSRFLRLLPSA